MKRTLLIYTDEFAPKFAFIEGDYSHLNGVYINSGEDATKEQELIDLLFENDGKSKIKFEFDFPMSKLPCSFVAVCGFLP